MSRSPTLDNPDFVLIDLDPQDCPFDLIVEAALLVRDKLDAIGLEGYPKTTGGDGMHIYIPLEPAYTYEESRTFAEILAHLVQRDRPELFTTPRAVSEAPEGPRLFRLAAERRNPRPSPRPTCCAPIPAPRWPLRWPGAKCGAASRPPSSISITRRSALRKWAIFSRRS